jgi:hypothetical protein
VQAFGARDQILQQLRQPARAPATDAAEAQAASGGRSR